jgi:Putative Actinobacterial Holin-X, holin superfamily III
VSGEQQQDRPQNIATAIADVSERLTLLVREEVELAKAEVTEKVSKLVKGAVVAIAAGIFVVTALSFALHGFAWLLYYELPIGSQFTYFWGFFAMAVILLVLGAIAGFIAARVVKKGAPPTPRMAIEEARKIRETVSASSESSAAAQVYVAPATAPAGDARAAASAQSVSDAVGAGEVR